jgi:hypothetical protein
VKGKGSLSNLIKKNVGRKNVRENFLENFYDLTYSFKVVIITFRNKKIFQNREKVTLVETFKGPIKGNMSR